MRQLLLGPSPVGLAAAAPLPAWLVVDPRRRPALEPGQAVAVDCGGRERGRIDPVATARRVLRAYDRRHLSLVVVAPGLAPELESCRWPGEPGWSTLDSPALAPSTVAGAVLLATLELPSAGWVIHAETADRARHRREALGDAAAEDLRAGRPTALVVTPVADGHGPRAAERAARALAIAALRAMGKGRAQLVVHGDAVLRALAAATREGAYRLDAGAAGLVTARLGKRQLLIALGGPPLVEAG